MFKLMSLYSDTGWRRLVYSSHCFATVDIRHECRPLRARGATYLLTYIPICLLTYSFIYLLAGSTYLVWFVFGSLICCQRLRILSLALTWNLGFLAMKVSQLISFV